MRTTTPLFCVALLALGACSSEPEDKDEIQAGFRAMGRALSDASTDLEAEVEEDGSVDAALPCPDGGTVRCVGTYDDSDSFGLRVEFNGCGAEGVRIDGDLDFSATVEADDNSAEVTFSYAGNLVWSGAAEGSCDLDLRGRVAAEVDGRNASASVEFSGHICGYDADVILDDFQG